MQAYLLLISGQVPDLNKIGLAYLRILGIN